MQSRFYDKYLDNKAKKYYLSVRYTIGPSGHLNDILNLR